MPVTVKTLRDLATACIRHCLWRVKRCAERFSKHGKLTKANLKESNQHVVGSYITAYCAVMDCDANEVEDEIYAQSMRFVAEPTDYFADRVARQLCERYCP